MDFAAALFIAAIIGSGLYIFGYPRWRRRRILATPLPEASMRIIRKRIPFLGRLTDDEQRQLLDRIRLFLAGKRFHGCGGLQVTDEIRLTIAAEACLLLLNRNTGTYPGLRHILVYPDAFMAEHDELHPDGTVSTHAQGLLGQSWSNGKIILSWDDVKKGLSDFSDGHNVVLHEFAHQLDDESGYTNGAPAMASANLKIWAQVFNNEFEQLNIMAEERRRSVMDYYGATNPAEFFAVATETFFEMPRALMHRHPELYEALRNYYRVDPIRWHEDRP